MGVATAVLATAIIAGAGISAWSSHQQSVNQKKRQEGLLKDAERKEQQIKAETAAAAAKSQADARKRVIGKQRAKSETILTGAGGLGEDETVKKQKLGA